jgi:hypothetical protein
MKNLIKLQEAAVPRCSFGTFFQYRHIADVLPRPSSNCSSASSRRPARKTRNMERVLQCMSAIDNANDTAIEHGFKGDPEDYPEYLGGRGLHAGEHPERPHDPSHRDQLVP